MFLNLLNNNQKELFLDLAIKAAEANGVVEIEEKNMLKAFSIEMQIPARYETIKSIDEILDTLEKITAEKERRILTFELIGIIFADGQYDKREETFMSRVSEKSGISMEKIQEMIEVLSEYEKVYDKICNVVLK